MKPGPIIIRKCGSCGRRIAQEQYLSGNTFGARFWTDGRTVAPMLPDELKLVKCPFCSSLIWIDEQRTVGEIDPLGEETDLPGLFGDAQYASEPSLDDYLGFLSVRVRGKRKAKYLRLRAWWAGNDRRREGGEAVPMTEAEKANLVALLPLLCEREGQDRLLKAEASRELGMFEEAAALLAARFDEELMPAVLIIRGLNEKHSTAVEEVKFEGC